LSDRLARSAVTTYDACVGNSTVAGVGQWVPMSPYSFDNVFSALQSLFEMSTTEGWVDLMYAGIDTSSVWPAC
jgi:hypothetical protein